MLKNRKIINLQEIDKKLKDSRRPLTPKDGWISTLRKTLNMSMEQLGSRLNISGQGVYSLEKREKEGSITINRLREAAEALGLEFSYILTPKTSLEALIEDKARKKAKEIIRRSHQNMTLENQAVSSKDLVRQEKEIAENLKNNLSKTLWEE